jgi:uncharacterized protein (DUF488 family)
MKCFAIGYQGRSLTGMCELLVEEGVDLLIDVRERAWSNRPEFRKTAIATALAAHGIEYVHVREAGNPFRPRAGEVIDALDCMRRYRGYLRATPSVVEKMRLLIGRRKVALLCYEASSSDCHRGVLIAALQRSSPRVTVKHL